MCFLLMACLLPYIYLHKMHNRNLKQQTRITKTNNIKSRKIYLLLLQKKKNNINATTT